MEENPFWHLHDWKTRRGSDESPECHLPRAVGQVGLAGHRDACAEHLRGIPDIHHDDKQLHC